MCGAQGTWKSVPSIQFCCERKTSLKMEVYRKSALPRQERREIGMVTSGSQVG